MAAHVYHPETPNYHEDALVFENCPECARKATGGLGHFLVTQDAARVVRFFERAVAMGDGLALSNAVERPLLEDASYLVLALDRVGLNLLELLADAGREPADPASW